MEVNFFIPEWLLWIIGILAGIVILFFAVIGILFVWGWKDGFDF